tara:strand:+ start:1089 stop:1445 length:357 start_codon:yes stop_codon:yes gene_type:complete
MSKKKVLKRSKIRKRIRKIVVGTSNQPRLSVFRSNKEIYAQLIDDLTGNTLASASSRDKDIKKGSLTRSEISKLVGMSLGNKAVKAGLGKVGFDRGGYLYHGRVKSLADGAREAGLKF